MVLENTDNQPNLKSLTIENPQANTSFDPDREFNADIWEKTMGSLRNAGAKHIATFIDMATNLKLLFPNRDLGITTDEITKMNEEEYVSLDELSLKSQSAYLKRLLHDESSRKIITGDYLGDEVFDDKTWNDIYDVIKGLKSEGHLSGFVGMLFECQILDPNRRPPFHDEETWQWIKNVTKTHRDSLGYIGFNDVVAKSAPFIKILYPDTFDELEIGPGLVSAMRKDFDGFKTDGHYSWLADFGLRLKVLSAKRVNITQTGLDFVEEGNVLNQKPLSPPEAKKF